MSCLYNILGVAKTASEIEIRQAYRKLAVQSHPQTTGAAVEEFKRITNAYEILVDDRKRAAYDLIIRSNESEPRQREPQKQSNAGQSNRGGYTKSSQSRRKRRAAAALRFLRRVCVGFLKFTAQVIVEAVANFDFVDCFVDLVD
ncbi:uncharacterized protein LOC130987745 [Salvia miltiorrhiza]|uniref:uncharacterized protein LOC130987745 n=1 Tax=Salvia miltiorrhiza TaxID=226208 RepID=UPI0025ABCB92|nr:uncharacterized protein LOC130987745 [Salvia miltiorrhiza]